MQHDQPTDPAGGISTEFLAFPFSSGVADVGSNTVRRFPARLDPQFPDWANFPPVRTSFIPPDQAADCQLLEMINWER
jgi:hypothetical protein